MKIFFFCGGMEPGRDGVGDYTRCLSGSLVQKGVSVLMVSLYDAFVQSPVEKMSGDDKTAVPFLRLPSGMPWKEKRTIIQDYVDRHKPDFISLQYVLYGFQPKGLPFLLAGFLKKLKGRHQWHIMFHELWVGKEDGNSLKMTLLAFLQRYIIRNMIHTLQPQIIHTQLPAYQTTLGALGVAARELPLFSNIRQVDARPTGLFEKEEWQVAFFSQVESTPAMTGFLGTLQQNIINAGKKLRIVLMGGTKQKMENFKQQIRSLENADTKIEIAGFLSPDQLSGRLNACVLGITPVVENGLGKSGSVAAFIEHELPVGVPYRNQEESAFFGEQLKKALLYEPTIECIQRTGEEAKKAKPFIDVHTIAAKFLQDLEQGVQKKSEYLTSYPV